MTVLLTPMLPTVRRITVACCVTAMIVSLSAPAEVTAQAITSKRDVDVERLLPWMEGTFTSQAQHAADTTYGNDTIHCKRIWHDRSDGAWFYQEYIDGNASQRPAIQQVYNIRRIEQGMIELAIYRMKRPEPFIGGWKDTTLLAALLPGDLVKRRGCEIFLQADYGQYIGKTMGMACAGNVRGVRYTTTDLSVKHDRLSLWERGYDAANEQVTGGTAGPQIFLRITPLPFGVEKD